MSRFGNTATLRKSKKVFRDVVKEASKCDIRKRALIYLMLSTGLRVDEAVQQKWSFGWGDPSADFVIVPEQVVKGKKRGRAVPYVQPVCDVLMKLKRSGHSKEFLFQSPRKKWGKKSRKDRAITKRTAQRWIRDVAKCAGHPEIEAHDLRRLFATLYYRYSVGGDMFGLQQVLGHQSPGVTLIYILDYLSRAADVITRLFAAR